MTIRNVGTVSILALLSACELQAIAIDISASYLNGDLTFGGGAFPLSATESGDIVLQGANVGDQALLGPTDSQYYGAMVVDGVYSATYSHTEGTLVPANAYATVAEGLVIKTDGNVDVDVPSAVVNVTYLLDGQPFPVSQYDRANIYLQPVGTDELIALGETQHGKGSALVVPGTYHVIYDYVQGAISPINKMARVVEDLVIDTDQRLVMDVTSRSLQASFTLNGQPFPNSEYDDANLHLRDEASGAETLVMNTHDELATVRVLEGTYDVVYRIETPTGTIPQNTAAVVLQDLVIAGDLVLQHDIVSVTFDARVTLNGAPFQVSEYNDGVISLYDPDTDTDTILGNTHSPFVGLVMIPGTYDVLYSHETGLAVPQNVRGLVASGVLVDGSFLPVNVPGIQVGADLTLDGEPFPVSEEDDANIFLVGELSDEDILVGNTHDAELTAMVMPGTYDLVYRHESGADVPQNPNFRLLRDQVLAIDTSLATDVAGDVAVLSATLNGAAFPKQDEGMGRIYARSQEGDEVLLLETGGSQFPSFLIHGDYEFVYEHVSGSAVPSNTAAVVYTAPI